MTTQSTADQKITELKSRYEILLRLLIDNFATELGFEVVDRLPLLFPFLLNPPTEGCWVRIKESVFTLFHQERGKRHCLIESRDANEILYVMLKSVTLFLATNYEKVHRNTGEDSRRQWFASQERMMSSLETSWSARLVIEHLRVLKAAPFNDHQ